MKINWCAMIVALLILTGYILIFSDIWVIAKDGVAIGPQYRNIQEQPERRVHPAGQERGFKQAETVGRNQ